MRLTALTLAGALGIGALGLAATAAPASAAPFVPGLASQDSPNLVEVLGGCGRGFHPVPGRWSRSRGMWIPPRCVPHNRGYGYRPYGYGGGYGGGYARGYGYGGGYRYGGGYGGGYGRW